MKKLSDSIISKPKPKGGVELRMYNLLLEFIRPENLNDKQDEKKGVKPRRDPYAGIVNSMHRSDGFR